MSSENDQQRIQDHYEDPYHRGRCERPTHYAEARNEPCGDVVAIELRATNEQISEIWFDGEGCRLSQAIASLLAEQLEGKRTKDVAELSLDHALSMLRIDADPKQFGCCQIGLDAIQAALASPVDEDLHDPTFSGPDLGDEC